MKDCTIIKISWTPDTGRRVSVERVSRLKAWLHGARRTGDIITLWDDTADKLWEHHIGMIAVGHEAYYKALRDAQ